MHCGIPNGPNQHNSKTKRVAQVRFQETLSTLGRLLTLDWNLHNEGLRSPHIEKQPMRPFVDQWHHKDSYQSRTVFTELTHLELIYLGSAITVQAFFMCVYCHQ